MRNKTTEDFSSALKSNVLSNISFDIQIDQILIEELKSNFKNSKFSMTQINQDLFKIEGQFPLVSFTVNSVTTINRNGQSGTEISMIDEKGRNIPLNRPAPAKFKEEATKLIENKTKQYLLKIKLNNIS